MGVEHLINVFAVRALHPHPNLPPMRGKGPYHAVLTHVTVEMCRYACPCKGEGVVQRNAETLLRKDA